MIPRSQIFVAGIVLLLAAIVPYAAAVTYGFVDLDDNGYVFENPMVAKGLCPESLAYAWTTFDLGNWIPITWMSLLLDASIHGIRPGGFHATNLLLHGCNSLLLWAWLARLTGRPWPSWAIAGLFAVHPLHVESVVWVAERKDLLSMLFLLLALIGYESYGVRPSWKAWGLVTVAFTLGLLSKPMLVTFPLLAGLIDAWRAAASGLPDDGGIVDRPSRSFTTLVLEKLPWFALAVTIGVVTIQAQRVGAVSAFTSFGRLPLAPRLANAVCGVWFYATKTIVPSGLCAMYAHPLDNLSWPRAIGCGMAVGAVTGLIGLNARRRPDVAWGWAWFLVSLLPVIGILQVGTQAWADRYSYIPQVGLLAALVWALKPWMNALLPRRATFAVLTLCMAALAWTTSWQVGFWKDTASLWNRALAVDPDNWAAHQMLGRMAARDGREDEAVVHLEKAVSGNPTLPEEWCMLASIEVRQGRGEAAEAHFRRALRLNPGHERAMHGLLDLLRSERRTGEAFAEMDRYLPNHLDDADTLLDYGDALATRGQLDLALLAFARSVAGRPDDTRGLLRLGMALTQSGRPAAGERHLRHGVELESGNASLRHALAVCLQRLGRMEEAKQQLTTLLETHPDHAEAGRLLQSLTQTSSDATDAPADEGEPRPRSPARPSRDP